LAVTLALCSVAGAQQPAQERPLPDRVLALERALADLDARVQARGSVAPAERATPDIETMSRLDRLEREVGRLTGDLTRLEQRADSAARDAADARRIAENADRLARDASRLR
jgi:hypothetical protein